MRVLVDTTVWSLAFRKTPKSYEEERTIRELKELIGEMRVVVIGPVRQELLTGISDKRKFDLLRHKFRAFDDEPIESDTYELAAEISNACRRHGIQGSHTDYLLCAFAVKNNCSIFTLDKDFTLYKKHIKLNLHEVRREFLTA